MADQPAWQRALTRYGDTVYRLALLRDPRPAIAAQAAAAAFIALDWQTITPDERLESRLLQALW
ncbi:MAG TPA: hypothetical protein VE268_04430, partial [Herpetosiphonaceae bacterium]|nr:hypothetical protein [Herpetosiphonaceae bacterium]